RLLVGRSPAGSALRLAGGARLCRREGGGADFRQDRQGPDARGGRALTRDTPQAGFVETGYAKINLALHVRARTGDGYHAIETVFAFADDGDRLALAPAAGLTLTIEGPQAAALAHEDIETNLVLRAVRAVRSAF